MYVSDVVDFKDKIIELDTQIRNSQMYAQYWISMAESGAVRRLPRKIRSGHFCEWGNPDLGCPTFNCLTCWREMTDDEKIDDALDTAERYIGHASDLIDYRVQVMEEIANVGPVAQNGRAAPYHTGGV